jgi:ADP-ribosyl-[dinitrogen reductase] hydrolase
MRTELGCPFTIDEVEHGGGIVGLSMCPGRSDSDLFGNGWYRDIDQDLLVLRSWAPDLTITLMEQHELQDSRVSDLGPRIAGIGLNWRHLPMPDRGVPGPFFDRQWETSVRPEIVSILKSRGRVLFHCKAGRRARLVAARLLIELGGSAKSIFDRLAGGQPSAIWTSSQLSYLDKILARVGSCSEPRLPTSSLPHHR